MYIYTIHTREFKIKKGIPMNIIISNTSSVPIYEQIEQQIKDMIVSGKLEEGEMLPSMRFLAKELRISLITTKRAYEELERDGFIESYTGRGSFVKAQNLMALLCIQKGEYAKAGRYLLRTLRIDAGNPKAQWYLAHIRSSMNREEEESTPREVVFSNSVAAANVD